MDFEKVKKMDYVLKALRYANKHSSGFRKADLYSHLGISEDSHVWKNHFDKEFEKYFVLVGEANKSCVETPMLSVKLVNEKFYVLSTEGRSILEQRKNTKWAIWGIVIAIIAAAASIWN